VVEAKLHRADLVVVVVTDLAVVVLELSAKDLPAHHAMSPILEVTLVVAVVVLVVQEIVHLAHIPEGMVVSV
jgi:hypothetical protein